MSRDEKRRKLVIEWVQKAENDLKVAEGLLSLGDQYATDAICFHSQQCVEKYLKALLVFQDINFPRTHDIRELIELAPIDLRPDLDKSIQDRLTDYAATIRYPGDYRPISTEEAKTALAAARKIRDELREKLLR